MKFTETANNYGVIIEQKLINKKNFFIHCLNNNANGDGSILKPIVENAKDVDEAIALILASDDEKVKKTQAYAVASKDINPDGKHWYRVRAMFDKIYKTNTYAGYLEVFTNDGSSFGIPNADGDGMMRFAIVEKGTINCDMMDFFGHFQGRFYVDSYVGRIKLNGRYGAYYYDGIVCLEKWD